VRVVPHATTSMNVHQEMMMDVSTSALITLDLIAVSARKDITLMTSTEQAV
jgi:hypothetical protein